MTKRSETPSTPNPPKRRVKLTSVEKREFKVTNVTDGEQVHQSCIAIHGECQIFDYAYETNFVSVSATDSFNKSQPVHHWPLHKGHWKALAMLAPGVNKINLQLHHAGGIHDSVQLTLNYIPLLQLPPLHLAILVACDSPLLTDCPPSKYGAVSTAHSGIDAAIAKFRMAAYMWQALTAEDFRQKGLGRRTFRLDEEWGVDTSIRAGHNGENPTGLIPKVHIIRSDKTVAELRDPQVAQQNRRGSDRDALHGYFEAALLKSGPPFESKTQPVVAGMLLDSHYDVERSLLLGHAALGCHKPYGLSLGIFGSHLTYSWPRFLEEVPACLTDLGYPGDNVSNDNWECRTASAACFVGQGAFFHEVDHAFGAGHTTGIMARGYSKSWAMNFIEHERNDGITNKAKWDLSDVLKFKLLPHFALPGDEYPVSNEFKNATVSIAANSEMQSSLAEEGHKDYEPDAVIKISCKAGLAQVKVQNGLDDPKEYNFFNEEANYGPPSTLHIDTTVEQFDRRQQLYITALGMNGTERIFPNAWQLLQQKPYVRIPGSTLVLRKHSVASDSFREDDVVQFIPWAVLLKYRSKKDGELYRATSIDLRVGSTMDGAVVHYEDGSHQNCGPARNAHRGGEHRFGGHASEAHDIPAGETIFRVLVCKNRKEWGSLSGIRMTLSNRKEWGCLNDDWDEDDEQSEQEEDDPVFELKPRYDEEIVGFFGHSDRNSGFTYQFGILTAPIGVDLPEVVYDMPELSNF